MRGLLMDRDYIWEGEYGRRNHLIQVFKRLLREQPADRLQMLTLFINNIPYNLEFFIAISYDKPMGKDIENMESMFEDAGLQYRNDLTMQALMMEVGNRRFNAFAIGREDQIDEIMKNAFLFQEIDKLEEKGYQMRPFGKEKQIFISHSSKDKNSVEKLIPYLNGAGLPVWFDKYSIHVGDSIVDKVQEGLEESQGIIFWITENFLASNWCKYEMRAFIKKLIEEDALIISILDNDINAAQLPIFLRDIKYITKTSHTQNGLRTLKIQYFS